MLQHQAHEMVETPKLRTYSGRSSQEDSESSENERSSKSLATDGSGPYDSSMETRVTRLETHMEYVRADLTDLKTSMKELTHSFGELRTTVADLAFSIKALPTKDDLWSWKIQWLAIGLAEFAIIVGAIVGGLDWIKTH